MNLCRCFQRCPCGRAQDLIPLFWFDLLIESYVVFMIINQKFLGTSPSDVISLLALILIRFLLFLCLLRNLIFFFLEIVSFYPKSQCSSNHSSQKSIQFLPQYHKLSNSHLLHVLNYQLSFMMACSYLEHESTAWKNLLTFAKFVQVLSFHATQQPQILLNVLGNWKCWPLTSLNMTNNRCTIFFFF